jgi:hypothetical protein
VTAHAITIRIDDARLAGYTDEFLAACWHVAQHNPAAYGDHAAGELAERIGREIIRRWLRDVPPELWHHQGRPSAQKWLSALATYEPGEDYRPGAPAGDEDNLRAFHCGRWVPKDTGGGEPAGGKTGTL